MMIAVDVETARGSTLTQVEQVSQRVESRLVAATWTLRRLPDKERSFIKAKSVLWPEFRLNGQTDYVETLTSFQVRMQCRLTAKEIDQMQPDLDLLQLLPDMDDRKLVFWASWHQDGEVSQRIPWAKVRRSMGIDLSRWTLKRRYANSIEWLSQIIIMQK